ncbi:hypothetical protein JL107_16905 [Nakamurella flavida]|uniref:Uncharacterized protein n=1 Tax=Nakamurella flavida TaxID=363630 RepID=A0A938YRI3_9ACTN|nr:hypothetical protein [Nakamurella flavida]MBM9478129.1 hypothetical protein [Nakamurella flavida]MDP9778649.1 hypothetical protein [Nakamurella flavida]
MGRARTPRRSLTVIGNLAAALGLLSLVLTCGVWLTGPGENSLPAIVAIGAGVAALARLGTAVWLTWHPHHARERLSDTALGLWVIGGVALLLQVVCLVAAVAGDGGGPAEFVALLALIVAWVSMFRLARPMVETVAQPVG